MTKLINNLPVVVDTSVWVNVFKGIATQSSIFLKTNVNEISIATCPIILLEVLQGLKSEHDAVKIKAYFDTFIRLNNEPYELALEAAKLYRSLRKKGITIRKSNDCLIAVYAIENEIALLHDDKDFDFIAQYSDLQLVEV